MRKLLIVLMILLVSGCAGVVPVEAEEQKDLQVYLEEQEQESKKLKAFCEAKSVLIQKVLYEVIDDNHQLHAMIREDVGDFVPVLFAQFKMENASIILWSVMVEMLRTSEQGEVFNITLNLLDQYTELLRYGMIKAKLFEGMIDGPDNRWIRSRDQLILRRAAVHLKVAHDLLVDIKKGLEELK